MTNECSISKATHTVEYWEPYFGCPLVLERYFFNSAELAANARMVVIRRRKLKPKHWGQINAWKLPQWRKTILLKEHART